MIPFFIYLPKNLPKNEGNTINFYFLVFCCFLVDFGIATRYWIIILS